MPTSEYIKRFAPIIIVVSLLFVVIAAGVIVHRHLHKDEKAPKVIHRTGEEPRTTRKSH